MIQCWHGRGTVDINLMHLTTSQQHWGATFAEGRVPGALCYRSLLHDDTGKIIGAAVVEVDAAGAVLQQIARAFHLSFQRQGAVAGSHADSGGIGERHDMVGGHIVFRKHQRTTVDLEVSFSCRRGTDSTLLTAVVEVGHGERTTVYDGLARIVAVLHVQRHVGILIDGHVAYTRDAALARKRVFPAVEEYTVCYHRFVESDCFLTALGVENHLVARHEGGLGG